jgi:hypothetical protein
MQIKINQLILTETAALLTEGFPGFSQSLQAYGRILLQIKQRLLHYTFFLLLFNAIQSDPKVPIYSSIDEFTKMDQDFWIILYFALLTTSLLEQAHNFHLVRNLLPTPVIFKTRNFKSLEP